MRLDIATLESAMASLIASYPELADDEQLRTDMLAGETDIEAVMTKLVRMAQDAKMQANAVATYVGELAERKARHERRHDAYRGMIEHLLSKADLSKLALPEATLTLAVKAPRPVVTDEAALPEALMKVKRTPDMTAINDAYKQTGQLPAGCSLTNGGVQLTVRTR